ncbi:MAG: nucleotidyltransferase domain-containing protein [Anaerolineae bacterium]|nr:nucleotidyltransferase domain-containing protein [Anaerolineae bacterium]
MVSARTTLPSHLQPNERAALTELLATLHQHYAEQVQHVILYGSKARGDFDEESDIDVLVVVTDDDWRAQRPFHRLASSLSTRYDVVLSLLVVGPEAYSRMRRPTPLYEFIAEEGIELWTKALAPTSKTTLPSPTKN